MPVLECTAIGKSVFLEKKKSQMAGDRNFFLRKFVQLKPVLAEELRNWDVYVQNT